VLLSETGEREDSVLNLARNRIKFVSMSHSPTSGEQMGRYLLGLGHRRIAFICPTHHAVWSRNRHAGLARAFMDARNGSTVTAFVLNDAYNMEHAHRVYREVQAGFARLSELCSGEPDGMLPMIDRAIRSPRNQVGDAVIREAIKDSVHDLLEQAIERKDITAWVASSDDTALDCLDFLAGAGRKVPGDISVAGFDDIPDATTYQLTSYNFNSAAAVQALLGHILASPARQSPAERRNAPVEIEGYVIARGTTGKAKR